MRLPRPRLRIWMLLVLVALVALGIGGEQMRRRRANYLQKAAEDARKEKLLLRLVERAEAEVDGRKADIADERDDARSEPPEMQKITERLIRIEVEQLSIDTRGLAD